jgi:hypothetical protein
MITKDCIFEPIYISINRLVHDITITNLFPRLINIIKSILEVIDVSDEKTSEPIYQYMKSVCDIINYFKSDQIHPTQFNIMLNSKQHIYGTDNLISEFKKYLFLREILSIRFDETDQFDYNNLKDLVSFINLREEIDTFIEIESYLFGYRYTEKSCQTRFFPKIHSAHYIPTELYQIINYIYHNKDEYQRHIVDKINSDVERHKENLLYKFCDIIIEDDPEFWNKLSSMLNRFKSMIQIDCSYIDSTIDILETIIIQSMVVEQNHEVYKMISKDNKLYNGWYLDLFYNPDDCHNRNQKTIRKKIQVLLKYDSNKQINYLYPTYKFKKSQAQRRCFTNSSRW